MADLHEQRAVVKLFPVMEKCGGDGRDAADSLQRSCSKQNASVRMVFPFQTRRNDDSRSTSFRSCFFDVRGIVHSEFVPPGQTVNQSFYLEVLRRLRHDLRKKRPELWQTGDWFFHHDNAPVHTALSVHQFLTKNGMTPVTHPPYLPDLAPCDFFLFPRMKKFLKGKRFPDVAEVKQKTAEALKGIKIDEFKNCFEQWKKRLDKCIASNGEYFEGD